MFLFFKINESMHGLINQVLVERLNKEDLNNKQSIFYQSSLCSVTKQSQNMNSVDETPSLFKFYCYTFSTFFGTK